MDLKYIKMKKILVLIILLNSMVVLGQKREIKDIPYYNETSRKMIEKHFEWELDKYKYTF